MLHLVWFLYVQDKTPRKLAIHTARPMDVRRSRPLATAAAAPAAAPPPTVVTAAIASPPHKALRGRQGYGTRVPKTSKGPKTVVSTPAAWPAVLVALVVLALVVVLVAVGLYHIHKATKTLSAKLQARMTLQDATTMVQTSLSDIQRAQEENMRHLQQQVHRSIGALQQQLQQRETLPQPTTPALSAATKTSANSLDDTDSVTDKDIVTDVPTEQDHGLRGTSPPSRPRSLPPPPATSIHNNPFAQLPLEDNAAYAYEAMG